MNDQLRPRHYAAACCALRSKAERQAYLAEVVPAHFRDWVRLYVEQAFKQAKKTTISRAGDDFRINRQV